MQTAHIRRRLIPARGNQFYRDKSFRGTGTYCGGAPSLLDQPASGMRTARQRVRWSEWAKGEGRELCARCLVALLAEQDNETARAAS